MPKSSLAKRQFVAGSLRGPRSVTTLAIQMAKDLEALRAQGERIQAARKALEVQEGKTISQSAMAFRIGVSPRGYQAWESGENDVSPENRPKLVKATGVPMAVLFPPAHDPDTAPDIMGDLVGKLNGNHSQLERLKRIEAKLDLILSRLPEADPLGEIEQELGEVDEPSDERDADTG